MEAYAKVNLKRKQGLDREKESKAKRRRIELLKLRGKESLERMEWSKKHGRHSYNESGCGNENESK